MKSLSCVLSIFLLPVLVSIGHAQTDIFFDGGPFFNDVIFNQDFTKSSGPFNQSVMINNTGDTVRIFLRNGGPTPAQGVSSGSVTLNGQVLFNASDFKIEDGALFAVVTKKIQLLNGQNTLDVELKGGGTGTMNLRILRASSFPAGTVFVAPGGVDSSSCGTSPSTPCKTIGQGLSQAFTLSGPQVVVANGVYVENVTIVNGIDVLGGFSSAFSTRNVSGTGTVIHGGASSPTVLAASITSPTLFEGFIVHGPTVTTAGGNSVVVSIVNSTNALKVQNNVIVGGVAGDGASGNDGAPGATGNSGTGGGNSQNGATTILGGIGGVGGGGQGGAGGRSNPPVFDVSNGSGASGGTAPGPGGGAGGSGGAGGDTGQLINSPTVPVTCLYQIPGSSIDALPGAPGGPGNNGSGGTGGLAGTGLSGTWVSANGSVGAPGAPGGGGGGGGAGGGGASTGSTACVPNQVTGPSGGGGGAGGAGGIAGDSGGQGGGGAFNIFVFNGGPTISSNQLFLGTGGNGGSGGQGGKGGGGGQGGPAGSCLVFSCGAAGAGGPGGNGGHAGGGGGGAGGPSVGIYSNFAGGYDTTNIINTTTGVAGFGGAGGQSLGNNGLAGTSGNVSAILVE